MIPVFKFTREIWFKIGCIITNDFPLAKDSFKVDRKIGYHYLNTNKCDESPLIRIYNDFYEIHKIEVNGDYTGGWQEIQPETKRKIEQYFISIS